MTLEIGAIVFAVGAVVAAATSIIKNVEMSVKVKTLIATVLSTVGGAITVVGTNGWDFSGFNGGDIFATALTVYGSATLIYNFILKGTHVNAKIEDVTVIPTGGGE